MLLAAQPCLPQRTGVLMQNLKDVVKQLLGEYHAVMKQKPKRIIFFRDGVSEGEFPKVRCPSSPVPGSR